MAFKARWSKEQKQAIEAAHLTHGWSGERVWRACRNGTLPGIGDRLPPFDIALSTVRDYITQARRRTQEINEISQDPSTVIREQASVLAAHYKRLVDRRTRQTKQLTSQDLQELSKAGNAIQTLIRALDPPKAQGGREKRQEDAQTMRQEVTQAEEPAPDFLDELAQIT